MVLAKKNCFMSVRIFHSSYRIDKWFGMLEWFGMLD